MQKSTLDEERRLTLPDAVCEALGWEPGAEVNLKVIGNELIVSPANEVDDLKAQARRLAVEMRSLGKQGLEKAVQALETVRASAASGRATAAFSGYQPMIPKSCYLAPGATVIGHVVLGEECSVWPGAVLRGDVNDIRIGSRTNIQDGAVVHVNQGEGRCEIGSAVTVGHQATLHACTIADNVLIGIHAVVLDGATVGEHCIIGAGAVVTPGTEIPAGKMALGLPAKPVRDLTPEEIQSIYWHADAYVGLRQEYLNPTTVEPPAAEEPPAPEPPSEATLARYHCHRATGEIVIDGSLDDAGWSGVPPMSPFRLSEDGGVPRYDTQCKACWDDERLYVAFSCKDPDVWGAIEERDGAIYDEEVVEAFLCPTGDLRHYFEFEVSPNNVVLDVKVFNPDFKRETMLLDFDWNAAGWQTAVRVSGTLDDRSDTDLGWICEMAIPWRDLGLDGPPSEGDVWRANFYRIERAGEEPTHGDPVEEFTAWSPTRVSPPDYHVPQRFGELVFVD